MTCCYLHPCYFLKTEIQEGGGIAGAQLENRSRNYYREWMKSNIKTVFNILTQGSSWLFAKSKHFPPLKKTRYLSTCLKKKREEGIEIVHLLVHSPVTAIVGNSIWVCHMGVRNPSIGLSFVVLPSALRNWTIRGTARILTCAQMRCWHCRWWLNSLCYTSPQIHLKEI